MVTPAPSPAPSSAARPRRPFVAALAIVTMVLAVVALQRAVLSYERPIAGVLLTPDCDVSGIGLPSWDGAALGLRFPDRMIEADGKDLTATPGVQCGVLWSESVGAARDAGRPFVRATVVTSTGMRKVDLHVTVLESTVWWLYGGGMIFVGLLFVTAGLIAISASPDGKLPRTFCKLALFAGLFFLTFFDWHTTRSLGVVFLLAFAMTPFSVVALALRLPDDTKLVVRAPWLLGVLDFVGAGLALAMVGRYLQGESTLVLRQICSTALFISLAAFGIILVVRFARARGTRREILSALLYAVVPPHALIALGIGLAALSSRGSTAAFFAIPASGLTPIAAAVAFIRYDIWGSRALLSRVLTRGVAAVGTASVAIAMGAAFATSAGVPFRSALLGATAGGVMAASLLYIALQAVDREFFPSFAEYKPTIEQLSEELTVITNPSEVAAAVERTVRRWLPCESVEVRLEASRDPSLPRSDPPLALVAHPIAFQGVHIGELRVGRKRGGALYTSEDVDLLRTIANQAALAIAHAQSYAELEQRRKTQAAAWQTERLALVETLAAEIAHEVRYPINFFRSVFRKDAGPRTLDDEEVDIACEEVDRLERMVAGFRRLVGHRTERRAIPIAELAGRAEVLLRDALSGRVLEIEVPRGTAVLCDSDQATQILVNLLSNALEASGPSDRVGLSWVAVDDGAELVVWDSGLGFESDPSRLFAPWFTTKPRGTGLGLAITQRLVRAHGWSIDAARVAGITRFIIQIAASDIVAAPQPASLVANATANAHTTPDEAEVA